MHRQTPLGIQDGPSTAGGVAAYAGSAIPGSLGVRTDDASSHSVAAARSRPSELGPAGNRSASFAIGSDRYRLVRLDIEWRQGLDEVRVPPQQALAIIEQATRQQQWNRDVARLLETAAFQLAGVHENGVFVLLTRQWFYGAARSVTKTAPRATPSALRPPATPEMPPSAEEPTMGEMQAVALKNAAAEGTPFCEECAHAAAPGPGTLTAA
jgi:hypothetical protein